MMSEGPAGVAQAHRAVDALPPLHDVGEDLEASLGLDHLQAVRLRVDRQAGGVIAPVLQALQAVQKDGGRLLRADESYNAAHMLLPPMVPRAPWSGRVGRAVFGFQVQGLAGISDVLYHLPGRATTGISAALPD